MLQPLSGASSTVSFIGAGLAMVAYGASAAVGLTEGVKAPETSTRQSAAGVETTDGTFANGIGCRLEAYACKGF